MAKLLTKHVPNIKVTLETTGAGVENIRLLATRQQAEAAFIDEPTLRNTAAKTPRF